jgi:hypothetical protein
MLAFREGKIEAHKNGHNSQMESRLFGRISRSFRHRPHYFSRRRAKIRPSQRRKFFSSPAKSLDTKGQTKSGPTR